MAAQIFATGFEDGSYDAEIIHDILPGGGAELADTSCLNKDTTIAIHESSTKLQRQFNAFTHPANAGNQSESLSFAKQQAILVASRQFRKQTEVFQITSNRIMDVFIQIRGIQI